MTKPRTAKKTRRSRAELQELRDAIYDRLEVEHPMTLRMLYYRLVSAGVIEKTEAAYKNLGYMTVRMRLQHQLPFSWISDSTRLMRKPRSYGGLAAALRATKANYRRALWASQPDYIEIWVEKDALSGVLWPVTSQWDVPLMVCRGYSSLSFLAAAAEAIAGQGKPTTLYYLGDADPSGRDIPRYVESRLRELAPDADISMVQLAVTDAQIRELKLPTRPTKKSDSRAKGFKGRSVEVDAIEPSYIRQLVSDSITRHIDTDEWDKLKAVEQAEAATLDRMVSRCIKTA